MKNKYLALLFLISSLVITPSYATNKRLASNAGLSSEQPTKIAKYELIPDEQQESMLAKELFTNRFGPLENIVSFIPGDEIMPLRAINQTLYNFTKHIIDERNNIVDYYFTGMDWPDSIKSNPFIIRKYVENILDIISNYKYMIANLECYHQSNRFPAAKSTLIDLLKNHATSTSCNALEQALAARNKIEKIVGKISPEKEGFFNLNGTGAFYLLAGLKVSADTHVTFQPSNNSSIQSQFVRRCIGKFVIEAGNHSTLNPSEARLENELLSFVYGYKSNLLTTHKDMPPERVDRQAATAQKQDIEKSIDYAMKAAGPYNGNQFNNRQIDALFREVDNKYFGNFIRQLLKVSNLQPLKDFVRMNIFDEKYLEFGKIDEYFYDAYKFIKDESEIFYNSEEPCSHEVKDFALFLQSFHIALGADSSKSIDDRILALNFILKSPRKI